MDFHHTLARVGGVPRTRMLPTFSFHVALTVAGLVLAFSPDRVSAVPACPDPVNVSQPDGSKNRLHSRGDEFFSWHETPEGYAVVKDKADGVWKYAKPQAGRAEFRPVPGARVGAANPAAHGLMKHVSGHRRSAGP